jgi:hypothetical protein
MRSLLPVSVTTGVVALVFTCASWADGAAFHRNSLPQLKSFGLADSIQSAVSVPRGGDSEAEQEEKTETPEPEILYLPGLLDVELKKTTQVKFQ